MTKFSQIHPFKCFLCNTLIDQSAKRYSQKQAKRAFKAGLHKPGMFFSVVNGYSACEKCAQKLDSFFSLPPQKQSNPLNKILIGIALVLIFGLLTWLQVERIAEESYWMIIRIWFIPIPVILLTTLGIVFGGFLIYKDIFSR
jgi:hypothetical protein